VIGSALTCGQHARPARVDATNRCSMKKIQIKFLMQIDQVSKFLMKIGQVSDEENTPISPLPLVRSSSSSIHREILIKPNTGR
jgi:hypothetical protein